MVVALDDVSLTGVQSEIVALVGESGSGKSTLGRVVVALERLDRGQRTFEKVEYSRLPERKLQRLRQRMHLVLQDPYLPCIQARVSATTPTSRATASGEHRRHPRVQARFEKLGVNHSEIKPVRSEFGDGRMITFRDPDNIQLEVFATGT